MKKVRNSIESKDSINTFKKLKYRNFLNKSNSKKIEFFLKKFYIEKIFLKRFSWKDFLEKIFLKRFSWKYTQRYNFFKKKTNKNNFLLITVMFIKLYFY